jgi:hypothetical protein
MRGSARAPGRRTALLLGTALLLAAFAPGRAAAQLPPDASWLTFDTPNFRVTFVEGLEPVARRAAERAEAAHELLSRELLRSPPRPIELIVADNVDFAHGLARVFPRNVVVVYAHPPASQPSLAHHRDWLELVVLHELVHIFHYDFTAGVWETLRPVLGRQPTIFTQIFTPGWFVEGLATYFESEFTGFGRERGAVFEMMLRTAILQDAFFGIDQVTLDPLTWPAGETRYLYGALFVSHLAERFGPDALTSFIEQVGRQIVPYRLDAAARRAFGATLTDSWSAWEDSLRAHYSAVEAELRARGITEPERLTAEGRIASFPRYSPDGSVIAYGAGTARAEPSLRLLHADGTSRMAARRTTLGPASWVPATGRLIYGQLDFTGVDHVHSDLYTLDAAGRERRLTFGARIWEPDQHPDGRRAVVVASSPGTNVLAMQDLETGETRALVQPSFDAYWSGPRWSPAGDRIAVSRWRAGGLFDVLLMDTTGAVVRQLTDDRAVDQWPAWSPDGRYVLFSSDRTGIPNLFAYDLQDDELWQVTNVLTGAFQPDVSPDGAWIVFSHYAADGYHIARIPFDPQAWRPAAPMDPRPVPRVALAPPSGEHVGGHPRRYSPWPMLLPTTWTLRAIGGEGGLGIGAGLGLRGEDPIERHAWAIDLGGYPDGGRIDARAGYRYRGWRNPEVDLAVFQGWLVEAAAGTIGVGPERVETELLRRTREASATASFLHRRWRYLGWAQTGADLREVDFVWSDPRGAPDLRHRPPDAGVLIGAGFTSARRYGLTPGPQDGFSGGLWVQGRRFLEPPEWAPEQRGYARITSRNRAFHGRDWPGFAPHVFAARLDGALETGTAGSGFSLGGTAGGPAPLPLQGEIFGRSIAFPVRGYEPGTQRGSRAFVGSLEYRFPLLLLERGFRLLPVSAHHLWGDVFVDSGAAWCPSVCPAHGAPDSPRPLVSVGAEAILDLRLGFLVDLPLRFGVALPLRDPGARQPSAYVRFGSAF